MATAAGAMRVKAGKDGKLRLSGWPAERRVVVLRRALRGEMLLASEDGGQGLLGFLEADRKTGKQVTGHEYAVLVTNLDHDILALGQLYPVSGLADPH